jgi:hypothetical protein
MAGAAWTTRALHLQDDPDYVPEDEDDDEDDESEDDEEDDGDDDDEEVETWQVVSRAVGACGEPRRSSLEWSASGGGKWLRCERARLLDFG